MDTIGRIMLSLAMGILLLIAAGSIVEQFFNDKADTMLSLMGIIAGII